MSAEQRFLDDYTAIAADYLRTRSEAERYRAAMLGREVVGAGFGPMQVTELHYRVLEALKPESEHSAGSDLSKELQPLFLELMSVFEASHQSVRNLVATLEDRCQELEAARCELQRTYHYLENVVGSMNDSLVVINPRAIIEAVNQTTLTWLRCQREELVGQPATLLFADPERAPLVGEQLRELFALGNVHNVQSRYRSGAAEDIAVSLSAKVMRGAADEIIGVVVIARDVTEVRELIADLQESREQLRAQTSQLIQTEKMKALGELAAGVAHELNQPLNVVRLTCEDILRDVRKERLNHDELVEGLRDVVAEVRRMAEIIDHMRIFSRRTEGGRREKMDARAPVLGVLRLLGQQLRTHGIDVTTDLPEGLFIHADPVRLEQVIMNLVSNARDAVSALGADEERHIRISARPLTGEEKAPERIEYEVADNGHGIPEEVVGRIFEPFFTTKVPGEGTGLGLSVSCEIVKEHGGTMDVVSRPGEGTRFHVVLPLVSGEDAQVAGP